MSEGVREVFPNLMGMKEYHHMSSAAMAAIIGTSRQTYEYKMQTGKFSPAECKLFCRHFGKSFDYLFATVDEAEAYRPEEAYREAM